MTAINLIKSLSSHISVERACNLGVEIANAAFGFAIFFCIVEPPLSRLQTYRHLLLGTSLGTRPSLAEEEEGLVNLRTYKFEVRGISAE